MLARRQRVLAAFGAGLCGVVIAFVLLGSRKEPATSDVQVGAAERAAESEASGGQPALDDDKVDDDGAEPGAASGGLPDERMHEDHRESGGAEEGEGEGEHSAGDDDDAPPSEGSPAPAPREKRFGTLDKDAIQEAMQRVKPLLRECYEQGLKSDPSLAGRVIVEFEIGPDGDRGVVTQGTVKDSEASSPFFEACVLQKVTGLETAAPEGGGVVKVTYPFQFDPGGGFGGEPRDEEKKAP